MVRWRQRRGCAAAATVCVALGMLAPTALGTARVSLGIVGGQLSVTVDPVSGTDGNHGLIIEPFSESGGRDGFRVRQAAFGDPAIESDSANCGRNIVLNDVVCNGQRGSIAVTAGSGADTVSVREAQFFDDGGNPNDLLPAAGSQVCAAGQTTGTAVVALGLGDDRLAVVPDTRCTAGTFPAPGLLAAVQATGGSGNDRLDGGPLGDQLAGGPDDDSVDGDVGDDLLEGDAGIDVLSGQDGRDRLDGGTGADVLFGGAGDDTLAGGTGNDTFDGGDGTDTVTYAAALPQGRPVAATIADDASGDGPVGERDLIKTTIENVIGGSGPDAIIGDADANTLSGRRGNDAMRGGGGGDALVGEVGNDELAGGPGTDTLDGGPDDDRLVGQEHRDSYTGGPGDDSIDARDGVTETIACGTGADTVDADLRDQIAVAFLAGAGCEKVFRSPADDGPPGRVLGRSLRVRSDRTARLALSCPRGAKVACRGTLTLRSSGRRARTLAATQYSVRVGRRTSLRLALRGGSLGRTVVATTREQGRSRVGPRSSRTLLSVRRGR